MASNSHQNSDTEVVLAKTEFEGESKDNKNVDYVNDWLNLDVNIQNEIWRGKKLREKKPKPDETENEYFVPDINFFESFVNQPRVRKGHLGTFKKNSSQSTPRSRCPCASTTSAASTYLAINRISRTNDIQTRTKKGKRCSMRIAELAVPTKRQCFETWRNKSDVLPEFMVERLKQHVMDQTPIVKIPEAIYCFQNERRVSSKKWLSSKHVPLKPKYQNHQMDARMLCMVFAHKVAKRLSRPINLTLNSDLEKLSTIVSSDIAQIMSKCQCTSSRGRRHQETHTDVSNKITFWITGILEELSFKILEEDLRVKMETEARMKAVVAIVEGIIEHKNCMKSKDLEDEEGPVLDFIDEVVENVMNVCEPPKVGIDSEFGLFGTTKYLLLGEESEKPVEPIESSDNKMSKLEKIFNSETSTQTLTEENDHGLKDNIENLTESEYFLNEISNIIDYIITKESGDDMSNGSGDDIENSSENEEISPKAEMEHNRYDENNEGFSPEAGIKHDVNDEILPEAGTEHDVNDENNDEILPEAEKEQDINDENYLRISSEAGRKHDVNDEILPEAEKEQDIKDENNVRISPQAGIEHENDEASDNAAKTHSNVSERFEIFANDSDDDKNSKIVMFPKKDLVKPHNPAEQIKTSTAEEPAPEPDEHKQAPRNPQNNKSNIMFAEPNQNLLSDADESWPADLGDKQMLKVSESASKSVSSLGRITENDEKHLPSPEDEDSMIDKGTGDTILQVNDMIEILDNMLPIEKHDTAIQLNEPLIETSTTEPGETQVDSKILDEKDMTVPKTCNYKLVDKSSMLDKYQTDSGEIEVMRTGSTTDRTEDDEIPSHKSHSQVDYGWKVHPKTAPSWVISWGQGRGEPSEDSIPIQIRPTKVPEIELRNWCKELEKAFANLQMWNNWINTTCQESLFVLQQKESNCPAFAQKGAINWMKLKRNVYKDALLWTKLYQRTDNNFKSLKKKYNNIEFSLNKMPSVLNRTICEKMREFEKLSANLHKMIVAAEYCAMCTCDKTKFRYHSNKDYVGSRTK